MSTISNKSRESKPRHDLWQGTVRLHNCRIIRDHKLVWEDLWYCTPHQYLQAATGASNGQTSHADHHYARVIDPQARFWVAQKDKLWAADVMIDCGGLIVSSGYIDLQINGAFGVDFTSGTSCFDDQSHDPADAPANSQSTSQPNGDASDPAQPTDEVVFRGLATVGNGVLAHGVTAILPTLVSSAASTYAARVPQIRRFMRHREERQVKQSQLPKKFSPRPVGGQKAAQQERLFPASPKGDLPSHFSFDPSPDKEQEKSNDFEKTHAMDSVIMEVGFADDSVMERPQARILGLHLEGPFISIPGAHQPEFLLAPEQGMRSLCLTYGSREWQKQLQGPSQQQLPNGADHDPEQPKVHCNSSNHVCDNALGECGQAVKGGSLFDAAWDTLEDVSIITLAPELHGALDAVVQLQHLIRETHARASQDQGSRKPVRTIVSAGHSGARIRHAVQAQQAGIRLLTHLFNAMEAFHHRDPGLIGLLGTDSPRNEESTAAQQNPEPLSSSASAQPPLPEDQDRCKNSSSRHQQLTEVRQELQESNSSGGLEALGRVFWSVIVDGIHVHPASLRIAAASHPDGAVLITDAISAMGLHPGTYYLGGIVVDISQDKATVHGQKDTLAGAVVSLDECVRRFHKFTGCDIVAAIEAASLHPAQCLGLEKHLGHTNPGADADLIFLDDTLDVKGCIVNGQLAWCQPGILRIIESTSDPRRFR